MGSYISIIPAWFRGPPEEENVAYKFQDDPNAGILAETPRDAISAGYRAWTTAFEKKNFASIALLYTPDCKVCPSGTRTAYGRQECRLGWESLIHTGVERMSFSDTLIESSTGADVIHVAETSNYHMYGADNKPIDGGKHMMIWRKINGKWYIHLHAFSSSKPKQKTATDYINETCSLWTHNYFARDFNELQNLYTDSCILCPPAWPQVEGSLPVQRFWARFPSMGVDHMERVVTSVDDMGPGFIHAELRYTMYDFRNGVIDIGKIIAIYKKSKDGRWCIQNEVFNSDSSLPSVSTEDETNSTPTTTTAPTPEGLKPLSEIDNPAFVSEA